MADDFHSQAPRSNGSSQAFKVIVVAAIVVAAIVFWPTSENQETTGIETEPNGPQIKKDTDLGDQDNIQKHNASVIRQIQNLLSTLGYSPGPIDGVLGPQTRTAIENFKKDRGLKVDGEPSVSLLVLLRNPIKESRKTSTETTSDAIQKVLEFAQRCGSVEAFLLAVNQPPTNMQDDFMQQLRDLGLMELVEPAKVAWADGVTEIHNRGLSPGSQGAAQLSSEAQQSIMAAAEACRKLDR